MLETAGGGSTRGQRAPKPDDPETKIQEWRDWLRVLVDEAATIAHFRRIFREIFNMLQSNSELPEVSTIYRWLRNVYTASAVSGMRRLADDHRGSISLFRLIGEIRKTPGVITRTWFLSQHKNLPHPIASRTFNQFAPDGAELIVPSKLRLDQDRLKSASRAVTNFADKYLAHRDANVALKKTGEKYDLTLGELDSAIDKLIEILRSYELLVLQIDYGDHIPTPQDDWRAVFKVAWLKDSSGS